jgi:hypothetical protein
MAACVGAVPGTGPASLALQVGLGAPTYAAAAIALDLLGARRSLSRLLAPRLLRIRPT